MISIVIVNFNGLNDTMNCIVSILKNFNNNLEIIIVDNSINDNDYITLINQYRDNDFIKVFKINNNGFGNACNYGAKHAKGEILFFLNNDTIINEVSDLNSLYDLVIINNFIVTPIVYNSDGTNQKNIGGFFSLLSSIIYYLQFNHSFKKHPIAIKIAKLFFKKNKTIQIYINANSNNSSDSIDWVSGCALFISKINFNKIGGFDENYFMYFEDQDLCNSHLKYGNLCCMFNKFSLTHYIGGSQKNVNNLMELIKLNSLIYYAQKNIKNGFILKYLIFFISIPLLFFNKRINFLFKNYFFK